MTNCIPVVQTVVRSVNGEDIIINTSISKIDSRTNGFTVSDGETKSALEQLSQVITKDSCFTAADSKLGFTSDPGADNKRYYSSKSPYKSPPADYILSSPPTGYKPVCVQLVARHGSRTFTKRVCGDKTLEIWQLAKEKNMLTLFGEDLKKDAELFMEANNQVG